MPYKPIALLLAFLLTGFAGRVHAQQTQSFADDTLFGYRLALMPNQHLVPLFTGDQRAHRLSFLNVLGTTEFVGSMGGIFPIVRVSKGRYAMQFSAAASLYTTLVRYTRGGQILNTDFFADLYFDFNLHEKFQVRTGAGHTSQHLSDDVAPILGINYVRDYYLLMGIYQEPRAHAMVYGGVVFNHNLKTTNDSEAFDLSNTPMFQFGFEHAPVRVGKYGRLFWAADIKLRGEVNYGSSQNVQAGIRFLNANKRAIRIAGNYGWGFDERGQFYTRKREFFYVGFYLDF